MLFSGLIVITKTSSLDKLYKDNNLPVIILNDWNELNYFTSSKLLKLFTENFHKTMITNIYPKLDYDYWLTF